MGEQSTNKDIDLMVDSIKIVWEDGVPLPPKEDKP